MDWTSLVITLSTPGPQDGAEHAAEEEQILPGHLQPRPARAKTSQGKLYLFYIIFKRSTNHLKGSSIIGMSARIDA